MEKLENRNPGYFVGDKEVTPVLVAGPIGFSYEFGHGQNPDDVLEGVLEKITAKAVDRYALKRKPDAYIYSGITVNEPEETVADGTVPARTMRHGSLFFFRTEVLE